MRSCDREFQVILIILGQDLAYVISQFISVADCFLYIVFHVELEEIVLPHEDVLCLVKCWVEGHLGVLCNIDALLESVFDCVNIPVHDL